MSDDALGDYLRNIARVPLLNAEQEVELAKAIEVGLFAEKKLDKVGSDLLSTQDIHDLNILVDIGKQAKERFIAANTRLVVSIARQKRFQNRGLDLVDLIGEGNLGLIRAVEKFDYKKGYKFSTYASNWIRQSIERGIMDYGREIRMPVHIQEKLNSIRAAKRDLEPLLGRPLYVDEISEYTRLSVEEIQKILETNRQQEYPYSLDQPLEVHDGTAGTLGDIIPDKDGEESFIKVLDGILHEELWRLLETLSEKERFVIVKRYGLDGGKQMTLHEVGQQCGLTRERIGQIEAKTLSKLRHPSRGIIVKILRAA